MSLKDELARRRQSLSSSHQTLLARRLKGEVPSEKPHVSLTLAKRPAGETAYASFAQQRIWFLQQLEPETSIYNEQTSARVKGPFRLELLEAALRMLLDRHETLHTHFTVREGRVEQVIIPTAQVSVPLTYQNVSELDPQAREAWVQEAIAREHTQPFDLASGLLWRTTLFQLDQEEHILLTLMHHIICDAWSISLFNRELFACYDAICTGNPVPLKPLQVQYADFAYWQQQWFETQNLLERQFAYWQKQLSGTLPVLELPTARPRPAMQSYRGSHQPVAISQSDYQAIQALGKQEGVTPFMILLAAFAVVLSLYSQQQDIIIGTLIAGRTHPELEEIIGYFANTLALRVDVSGNPTCHELLQRVRAVARDAYANQDIPFEKLVEYLQPARSMSHTPVFQAMLILQNVPAGDLASSQVTLSSLAELEGETAKFDVMFNLQESPQGLKGYLEYSTDLFDASFAAAMTRHFVAILQAMEAYPQQRIAHLAYLSAAERQQLLRTGTGATQRCPSEKGLAHLFEVQVAHNPEGLAVICEGERLTYAELNRRANRLAHYLGEAGVGAEILVALLLERGWQLLTAILAVFKVSGAYLPLDPQYPPARLSTILEQSQSRFVLTTHDLRATLDVAWHDETTTPRARVWCIEDILSQPRTEENLAITVAGEQLAYVIYTSGSTGRPKGVMIEQRGMINHLYSKVADLALSSTDIVAQTASQCFDISVWQFLSPLIVGACVQIFPDAITHDPALLFQQVDQQGVTILETVPSLLEIALEGMTRRSGSHPLLGSLRWLLLTGEALPPGLTRSWFQRYPAIPVLNAYGPTECSDDIATAVIPAPLANTVIHTPIGGPIINTCLYVLSPALELLPVGVPGELYAGGSGVGRGYYHQPALTAASFLPDPFSTTAGARLYKTGDNVRWLPDGTLEYLGRLDTQVKLRGYRIELGEIEALLAQHPAIQQCVLLIRDNQEGEKYLAAYFVTAPGQPAEVDQVRQFLREHVPEYMVPTAFVRMDALPLSANGKIDRRALPDPATIQTEDSNQPQKALEELLTTIWAQTLGLPAADRHDHFFTLGGNSLGAVQLMSAVQATLGVQLPLRWFLEHPTVADLMTAIKTQQSELYAQMVSTANLLLEISQLSDEEVAALLANQENQ